MFTEAQQRAARWVLQEALETKPSQSVLILCDEHTCETGECLREAGETLGFEVKMQCVPEAQQVALSGKKGDVVESLRKGIDAADRVIVLQRRTPGANYFRLRVLEYCSQNSKSRRAASMPGVALNYLPLCIGALEQIAHRCDLVADLIVRSSQARLQTTTLSGDRLDLIIDLGQHKPIKSTGRIARGDWGNVPSGESFIVPDEGRARGRVTINGSIVNYPIPEAEELILHFENGRVLPVPSGRGGVIRQAAEILFTRDGSEAYPRCSVLAELGVGTNRDITTFTGLPIFDEKILGTVHLGLGRNIQFGGSIDCPVHNDYVVKGSTLILDATAVVDSGVFVLKEKDVYPNWRNVRTDGVSHESRFVKGREEFEITDAGVNLSWASHRSDIQQKTQIGDPETSAIARELLSFVQDSHQPLSCNEIRRMAARQCDRDAVVPTLSLLHSFRLLRLV